MRYRSGSEVDACDTSYSDLIQIEVSAIWRGLSFSLFSLPSWGYNSENDYQRDMFRDMEYTSRRSDAQARSRRMVTDASGKFVIVDVGARGGNSDGGVFSRSEFGKRLMKNMLDIPADNFVPETNIKLPYVFVADDAFPLRGNMKPYPLRQLSRENEIYNYRLSRARNSVECSFGRMTQMWRILFRQIDEQPAVATDIVIAITVLYNFLIIFESERSTVKSIGTEDEATPEEIAVYSSASDVHVNIDARGGRATQNGIQVREALMNYFISQEGSVHWQGNKCYLLN